MADDAMADSIPEGRPHFWYVPRYPKGFYDGWIDRAWLSQRFLPDYPEHAARVYTDDEFAAQVDAHFKSLSQEDLQNHYEGPDFGYPDISDVPARIPEAIALEATEIEQAQREAARLWEGTRFQERGGHRRDGTLYRPTRYEILDTWGFTPLTLITRRLQM